MNENATTGKLMGVILTLVVAVLIIATVMVPVISDAQKTAGVVHNYSNSGHGYDLIEDDTVVFTCKTGQEYYTVNGVNYPLAAGASIMEVVMSDAISITQVGQTYLTINYLDQTPQFNPSFSGRNISIVFENGTATYSNNNEVVYSAPYTYVYCLSDDGEYRSVYGTNPVYVNSINDIIMSGSYTTGENDTYYSLYKGELKLSEDYTGSVNITFNLVEGMTDVYTIQNPAILVESESFVPWQYVVKADITGHEAKGSAYSLYGVIPVIVLVSLLGVAVSLVRSKLD